MLAPRRARLKPPTGKVELPLSSNPPATRLHIKDGLPAGGALALDAAQAHRLLHVLRLGAGAAVIGFNEQDGEWLCRLAVPGRGKATLLPERQLRPAAAAEADLWLVFAPIKRARLDWLVEKATELGVAALVPVWTERAQPERVNRDRLVALAVAAAEQSERLSVPAVHEPQPLGRVLAAWPAARRLMLCDETGGGAPIAAALAGWPPAAPAALLVGPEGGFTERELDALGKLPIVTRVGLGPRVLRAETAALAALAVFQAVAGDGGRVRPR